MAGHKELKNIAHGLLGTFVSRNNDINGYWGIGILKRYAVTNDSPELILDLLARHPNWSGHSPVQIVENKYQRWLFDTLARAGVDCKQLKSAEIRLRFATFDEFPDAVRDTQGEPYKCSVVLTTREGNVYSASEIGVCAPHDPKNELRSTRVE